MPSFNRTALGGGVLLCAFVALSPVFAQAPGGRPPPSVIVATAERRIISDDIEALGTVRANESVRIASKVTEQIVALRFDDGQRVAQGDVLVELDDAEQQAELKAAQAALVERQNNYRRAAELATKNVGAKASQDDARALLLAAEADIEAIRVRIADHLIRAPFAGVVGLRDVSVGALVGPGDVLATLDDIGVVKLDFAVPAAFVAALKPGLVIQAITSAWPGKVFDGTVRSVDTRVDPVTRTVVVRALLANDEAQLLPGMLMRVNLRSRPREALLVPEAALVPQGGQQFVFLIDTDDGNKTSRRGVRIGTRIDGAVEIVDGLLEGDLVVTHGTIKVRPGQPVQIRAVDDGSHTLGEMLATPAAAQ